MKARIHLLFHDNTIDKSVDIELPDSIVLLQLNKANGEFAEFILQKLKDQNIVINDYFIEDQWDIVKVELSV